MSRRGEVSAIGASAGVLIRRMRTDLTALLGIVALVAATVALAVAVPSHVDTTLDRGAREAVAAAGPEADLLLRTTVGDPTGYEPTTAEQLIDFAAEVPAQLPDILSVVTSEVSGSVLGPELAGSTPETDVQLRIGVLDPTVVSQLRVVAGDLPTGAEAPTPSGDVPVVRVAVSSAAASAAGIAVGDSFTVAARSSSDNVPLTVVGIVDAVDPSARAWTDLPGLWDPRVLTSRGKETDLRFTVLAGAADFDRAVPAFPESSTGTIRVSFDPDRFDFERFFAVREGIDALETSSSDLTATAPLSVSATSQYEDALEEFPIAAAAARAQLSTLAAGLLGVAVLVTILASTALARRRQPEIELLRTRGASVALIGVHAAAESVIVTLLGAGVGVGVAVGAGFGVGSVLLLATAAGVIAAAPVVSALRQAIVPRASTHTNTVRIVGGAALVATTATAVVALRSGSTTAAGAIDPLSLAAPILCAAVVALALSPLSAAVLRPLSALASRTRGPGALLAGSSARDGRSMVTLIALTLASSVAITSLVLLHTVSVGQESASWRAVGADVRVDGPADPAALAASFADAGSTAAVVTDVPRASLEGQVRSSDATLLAVDSRYADLLAALPADQRAADATAVRELVGEGDATSADQQSVPVLLDPRLTRAAGDAASLDIGGVLVPVTIVGSPIAAAGPTAIVDRSRLEDYLAAAGADTVEEAPSIAPTTVLAVGEGADSVAALVDDADDVLLRAAVLAQLRDGALVAGVTAATELSLLATALLAVLALVTTTVIGVRRRGRVLALLGALGVPKRTGTALSFGELAPIVLSGVAGGCLAAAVVLTVAGSAFGVDLLAGGTAPLLIPSWLPVTILGAAAVALAIAVAVDIPLSRRVRTADILRTGEEK